MQTLSVTVWADGLAKLESSPCLNPKIKPTGYLTPNCNFRANSLIFLITYKDTFLFLVLLTQLQLQKNTLPCKFSNDFRLIADKFSNLPS